MTTGSLNRTYKKSWTIAEVCTQKYPSVAEYAASGGYSDDIWNVVTNLVGGLSPFTTFWTLSGKYLSVRV